MQFSGNAYGWFAAYAKYWADALFPNLQQKDWVALETFDMKTRIEVDFTQDKDEVRNAIYHLYFPGFSESNVFDALKNPTGQSSADGVRLDDRQRQLGHRYWSDSMISCSASRDGLTRSSGNVASGSSTRLSWVRKSSRSGSM